MKQLDKTDLVIGLVTGVGMLAVAGIVVTCLGFAGCFNGERINNTSSSVADTSAIYGSGNTTTVTALRSLDPATSAIRESTNNNALNEIGKESIVDVEGTTVSGSAYSSNAFMTTKSQGYVFGSTGRKNILKSVSINKNDKELAGEANAVMGTIYGIDETNYIWSTATGDNRDAWANSICAVKVDAGGKALDGSGSLYVGNYYMPFYDNVTKRDDGGYDFTYFFRNKKEAFNNSIDPAYQSITDVNYIYIEFKLPVVDSTTLSVFNVKNLRLVNTAEDTMRPAGLR